MSHDQQRGWVAWFASNPVAANLLMWLILVGGALSAVGLKVEAFPPLPPTSINVSVEYLSGSAQATEQGVTLKLEEALQGVAGIKKISSWSHEGGASLRIERSSGYDLDKLYTEVKGRIDSLGTLPAKAEKPVVRQEVYLEDALNVHIYGPAEAEVLQQSARRLRQHLLNHPAIERINLSGSQSTEVAIELDERQLQAQGLSLATVAERIAASSVLEGGGELQSSEGRWLLRADQPRYWQQEFADILLKETADGQRLTLGQVAQIQDGYVQSALLSRFNGQPAIWLDIKMYKRSDIMAIAQAVRQEVSAYQAQLPEGVEVAIWNDQSQYIGSRLSLLFKNSLSGLLLVMVLLALFLNVRVAFWVGMGIPVIVAGALLLMDIRLFDLSINELTTFGFIIAIGIVVDDAVVVGESIHSEHQRAGASLASTIRGAQRVAVPTVFGVLTTVVAFMALTLVEGEMGKIFSFFAYAAAFCLVFSLLESKLILPAHLASSRRPSTAAPSWLGRGWRRLQQGADAGLQYFSQRCYRPLLTRLLRYPGLVLCVALSLLILVLGWVPAGKVRAVFFPDIPSDFIQVELATEPGLSQRLLHQQALALEQLAQQVSQEVQQEYQLAQAPIPHLMTLAHKDGAVIIAGLSPREQRPLGTEQLAQRWQQRVGALEGVRKLKFITAWEGAADVSIELRAAEVEVLQQASARLQQQLQQYPGVSGVQNSLKAAQAQIELQLTPAGQAAGLTTGMLAQQLQQAYQGYEVQRMQRDGEEVKVKVRYLASQRQTVDDLQRAHIRTAEGQVLPLTAVASWQSRYVATEIERADRNRVAILSADLDKAQVSSAELMQALEQGLFSQLRRDYPQLQIVLGGEAQEEAETNASMQTAFVLALIAIYALIAIPLRSYWQPLLIMAAIPFGILGALVGHWLHDLPLSVLSMFGILALSGVVVNDSLLLVSAYNEGRRQGMAVDQALLEAGCSRLRAILLTSVTTYAGLVPLIWETAENAQFLIPAAVAMGYGILAATLITLVLIPSLIRLAESLLSWRQERCYPQEVQA